MLCYGKFVNFGGIEKIKGIVFLIKFIILDFFNVVVVWLRENKEDS